MSDYRFGEFCRLCIAQSNNLISIETLDFDHIPLIEKLKFVNNNLIPENDPLPKWICNQCKSDLTTCYNFQKRCVQSLNILNECYSQIKQNFDQKDVKLYITNIKSVDNKITPDIKIKNEIIDLDTEETDFLQITDVRTIQDEETEEGSTNQNGGDFASVIVSPTSKCQIITKNKKTQKSQFFQCKFCSKKSRNKEKFLEHIKLHGIELFCSVCAEGFLEKEQLIKHLESHITKVDKNYVCKFCEKTFIHHETLKKHYATHKNLNADAKEIVKTVI